MRRLRWLAPALLLVVAVFLAWEPTRVGLQTLVLLPNLLDAGPKPLNVFSAPPQRVTLPYRAAVPGEDAELADLCLPSWASAERPAGGMLLVFGVNNLGRTHPAIERVADGLARSGVAVLVPDSATLLEGRLEVAEIDGVVRAFQLLVARPEVEPTRVGMVGFSVGGSLALLAAADARIAGQVRWVNAFGAYADAATYLASVAAHAYVGPDGEVVSWTPTPLAREVFLRFLLDELDTAEDRAALEAAFGDGILDGETPSADPRLRRSLRGDDARAVHDVLTAPSLDAARQAVAELPAETRRFIDAISPVHHLDGLRADVLLMHEVKDHHVPYVESRRLADALDPTSLVDRHTEFRLFDHVQPDEVDLMAAAPELLKLLLHVRVLLEETL